MQAVHRSFFSSVHLATESGLVNVCRERGVAPRNRLREAAEDPVGRIKDAAGNVSGVSRALKDLRAILRTTRPAFDDHLEGALSTVKLSAQIKKTWR